MQKLFLSVLVVCLYGCGGDRSSLETYQKTARIDNSLTERYHQPYSATEEYVNRVAKRVSMVSDRPTDNFTVNVDNSSSIEYSLDTENHVLNISQGALAQLKDEAELAAVLTIAMARLNNATNLDDETATTLYKAGYDPHALLDLQEQYYHAENRTNWLSEVFPTPPTATTLEANKTMIDKMPKGLLRGSETYTQHING